MIEVLVAMLIVAMGILALAGLLQAASRYGKMSELRSTATLLANDIADRIRANSAGAAGAEFGPGGYDLAAQAYPSVLAAAYRDCTSDAPCSPAGMARADMAFWTARLRATLPDGSAQVLHHAASAGAPESVDVWVGWTDPNVLAPGAATERSAAECPAGWSDSAATLRCIHLQVGL